MNLHPASEFRWLSFSVAGTLLILGCLSAVSAETISEVVVSPEFFNPSVGETVKLNFLLESNGQISAVVVDRDGFVVRTLARDVPVSKGASSFSWNGRDQDGHVVADEAYSFKLDMRTEGSHFSYFPAGVPQPIGAVPATYFDRTAGILSYTLAQPSRVFAWAGVRKLDGKTGKARGPMLATIVRGEPRSSGPVVEAWNGLLDCGLDIPRLPGFAVAIAAQKLAANSVIAVGNGVWRFSDYSASRKGTSLIPGSSGTNPPDPAAAYDTFSTSVNISPVTGTQFAKREVVFPRSKNIKLNCELAGLTHGISTKHPADILVYLDDTLIKRVKPPRSNVFQLNLSTTGINSGQHYVAVNWRTPQGSTAIGVLRFTVGDSSRVSRN